VFEVSDDEGGTLHLVWSRSGRRLILSVTKQHGDFVTEAYQVVLDAQQAGQLRDYIERTLEHG